MEESDFVRLRREAIRALLDELDLGNTTPAEKVSKRSRIMDLWEAVVSETNDAADKEKLALAEKQLYHAHLARLELESITEAQRGASAKFIDRYNRDRDAELRAQQQPRAAQQRSSSSDWWTLACLGSEYGSREDAEVGTPDQQPLGTVEAAMSRISERIAAVERQRWRSTYEPPNPKP
eukprot:CAMPEP_0118896362 /NCGR_PEP_ID=MMETSP1166-20130328/4267_1 /TAXON_ID=1104430 /ORGANISM="Chrysoreinhardia sp, Strain CCMP3193" /LENGTH=178 /DNA_ID=CAMNT_0006835419 /DNA_START=16 /DNA_END=552 /DNA_ORIENTATION=+